MAASDQKIVEALETLVMTEMECPVCMELIQSPVFQCTNGHLICSSCLDQISLCPTCRTKMPSPRIRNLLAECFVIQKCPNAESGCQVRMTSKYRKQHDLDCEFRPWNICHRIELQNVGVKCNQLIKKSDISSHMKNEHNLTVVESNEAVISQEIDSGMEKCARFWFPTTFFAFDKHFFLNTKLISGEKESDATVYWKCICAGSVEIANGFSVELTLFGGLGARSLKWEGSVATVDETKENSLDTLSIPLSMLRQFSQRVSGFEWTTKIIIKQTPSDMFNQLAPSAGNTLKSLSVASLQQVQQLPEGPASSCKTSDTEYKLAYKHILGIYQLIYGENNPWNKVIYSINGRKWTKMSSYGRNDSYSLEQTFILGEEYTYKYNDKQIRKATAFIAGNTLIRKVKILLMHGADLIGEGIQIEEFNENKMVMTWVYNGIASISTYKKVGG